MRAKKTCRLPSVVMVALTFIQLLSMLAVSPALAETESPDDQTQRPRLGGPQEVENEIESDRAEGVDLYEIPFLKPYFDWKDGLADKYGFSFGMDYTVVGLRSSNSLPGTDDDAIGGVFRLFGSWELLGRGTDMAGSLVYGLNYHDAYSDPAPEDLALASLGYVGLTNPLFNDKKWTLAKLYWRQSWKKQDIVLIGGYHDIADFADAYALTDPFKHFSNLAFLTGAATISLPSAGSLGMLVGAWFNDNIYLQGGLTDANGDATDPTEGFDTFVDDNEYFTHLELGWTTAKERAYLDNIHVTLWHVDEREEAGTEGGGGAACSFSRWLQDRYLPFVKAGYAHDGSSLLEKSVSAGIGYQPRPIGSDSGNLLGVGVNWGKPNSTVFGPDLDDQYGIEVFYRWQLSKEFAITPDVQLLINPALNRDEDHVWLFGLRARVAL